MTRTLSLKRETLTDLSDGELSLVAAGAVPTLDRCPLTANIPTLPVWMCAAEVIYNITH